MSHYKYDTTARAKERQCGGLTALGYKTQVVILLLLPRGIDPRVSVKETFSIPRPRQITISERAAQ